MRNKYKKLIYIVIFHPKKYKNFSKQKKKNYKKIKIIKT